MTVDFKQQFSNLDNEVAVKKMYRKLAVQYHPDMRGETAEEKEFYAKMFQLLNDAYQFALKAINGSVHEGRTYRYNEEWENEIMDIFDELMKQPLNPAAEIHIMGTWVWVFHTKKSDKDFLNKNGVGMKWHSKKKAWYYRPAGYWSFSRGETSVDDIAAKYGASIHRPTGPKMVSA